MRESCVDANRGGGLAEQIPAADIHSLTERITGPGMPYELVETVIDAVFAA